MKIGEQDFTDEKYWREAHNSWECLIIDRKIIGYILVFTLLL